MKFKIGDIVVTEDKKIGSIVAVDSSMPKIIYKIRIDDKEPAIYRFEENIFLIFKN